MGAYIGAETVILLVLGGRPEVILWDDPDRGLTFKC